MSQEVIEKLRLGRRIYLIKEKLNRTREGDSEIYRAYSPDAGTGGQEFAILKLPASRTSRERLAVLERLSQKNSNLPAIVEHHLQRGAAYVVLPWIQGRTLRAYIEDAKTTRDRRRTMSVFEAIKLFHGFAHGLTQLNHQKNLVHGDLKPENLIVQREPNRLVMIDFGSAWMVERTELEERPGTTSEYAAPELHAGGFADFRSDVFSASVIFFEMLTFTLPYGGAGGKVGLDELRDIYLSELKPPSELSPGRNLLSNRVWRRIDEVVLKGLAIDPNDRYENRATWLAAIGDVRFELERSERLGAAGRLLSFLSDLLDRITARRRKPGDEGAPSAPP